MPVRRRFPWTRRFIHKYFPPVSPEVAERWERRLSVAYFFVAWNAILAVGYSIYSKKEEAQLTGDARQDKINRVRRLMSASQSDNIRYIEFKGFTKVSDEIISGEPSTRGVPVNLGHRPPPVSEGPQ